MAYLFIAHDLALVKQVSDRVAVMYLGKLVEIGPAESLYREPLHPYTVALLASIPSPDPSVPRRPVADTIRGELPSPINPPSGCRFRTRCPRAQDVCAAEEPPLRKLAEGHFAACHFPVGRDGGNQIKRRRHWQEEHMTLQHPSDTLESRPCCPTVPS